jgi:hypothetical protein
MKILQVINEANVASKIKDPKTIKMLSIAMRHDHTLPKRQVAMLGAKPTEEQVLKLWSDMLDTSLRSTDYGDISADGKFDEWLTRLYMNGVLEYEDINGEGGDALGAWKALARACTSLNPARSILLNRSESSSSIGANNLSCPPIP